MPTYDYRCTCGTWWEEHLRIDERERPLSEPCPGCESTGNAERFLPTSPIWKRESYHGKVPNAFKDILKKMKKEHRGNVINTQD